MSNVLAGVEAWNELPWLSGSTSDNSSITDELMTCGGLIGKVITCELHGTAERINGWH